MRHCLIAYDISEDRIRRKVSGLLEEYGVRLQKSVFMLEITSNSVLQNLENKILAILADTDSLMILPCCKTCFAEAHVYSPEQSLTLVA